jgi:hypothetical protein
MFRIQVKYLSGLVKALSVSFKKRNDLDNYVRRFHPELIGKESASAD